jgi:hypothetical protein
MHLTITSTALEFFFDLKKAFDVCSHAILLMKLSKMGIISILQGSILGPILFLCFINDLYLVTTLLTLMFADDTFTLDSGKDLNELVQNVNVEINKMAIWFRANKLAVNINKTIYIIFRMKGKNMDGNTPDIV